MAERLRPAVRTIADPIARGLARLGFTPNGLTVVGVLITALAAVVIATGQLLTGAIVLLLASAFDLLDGTLARLTGQSTTFGAFFDSTLDRYSEAIVFVGLAAYFLRADADLEVILCLLAVIGSFMVSYTRARAEGLGIACQVGWLARPERIILTAAGLITGLIVPVLWVLAILTNVTAVQRVWHVWNEAGRRRN